jgi:glycosyltransferase involved in cell wall biosynthesis
MNIVFLPIFKDTKQLTDHYYRLHWYLYPLRKYIDRITLFYDCDSVLESPPEYLNIDLLNISKKMSGVEMVRVNKLSNCEKTIKESDIVLISKVDNQQVGKIPLSLEKLIKGKYVARIDHNNERHASSFYLKLAELFPDEVKSWTESSKHVFTEIYTHCKYKKGYIFGTGPNLSLVKNYDFHGGRSIVCNSMVRNRKLLDRLQPSIIVMADPIFHAGPSTYAATFRAALIEALDAYDSYLIVPMRDYHIYKEYLPSRFHNKISGVPYKEQGDPNLDLSNKFYVTSTANISTLFLIPLASTLFKEIEMSGFDGRPLDDDKYFWKFDASSQFNDHMDSIKRAHPAFFDINYNDYYLTHCETLGRWLKFSEKQGCKYTSITPSHIPSLRDRYNDFLFNNSEDCELIKIDPDGLNDSGHYMSMNDNFNRACVSKNIRFSVFSNVNCSKEIADTRPFLNPVFTIHSWVVGNKPEGSNSKKLEIFSYELSRALSIRADSGINHRTKLYMYCGSLPAAKVISDAIKNFNNVSATICLFWLAFTDYNETAYVLRWREFILSCLKNEKILLVVPTKALSENIKKVFGVELPVMPHPSTTFSDDKVLKLIAQNDLKIQNTKNEYLNIIFPGGVRLDKGIHITADIVSNAYKNTNIKIKNIVRLAGNKRVEKSLQQYVDKIKNSDCTIVSGDMNDKQFSDFLKSGDVAILPNQPPVSLERTSGLLIDLLYLGVPVIVSDGTWLSEIVNRYKIGIVVYGQSYIDYNEAINELVGNYDSYINNINKAKQEYFNDNSWEGAVDFLLNKNNKGHSIMVTNKYLRDEKANIDETNVIAKIYKDLPPQSVMIDVGAHHGSALRHFEVMNWKIFAFEPDPENKKYLTDRFESNKNIVIDYRAVGEKEQKDVEFYSSDESTGISGLLSFRDTHKISGYSGCDNHL